MINHNIRFIICSLIVLAGLSSCKHEPFPVTPGPEVDSFGNYPPEVGRIIVKKCAESCHEPAFAQDNADLSMDTWEHLFNGANNGAVVVPFSPQYSSLMYYINTDSSRGPVSSPQMPYNKNPPFNRPPLDDSEYNIIKNWIAKGAPDKNGNIPFASNAATRQKVYMTMQGCNLVGVVDAEKKVIMRYIKVNGTIEDYSPHTVRVDPKGEYAYVSFVSNGQNLLKINTATDQVEGRIKLNPIPQNEGLSWNAFHISEDGSKIAVTNLQTGTRGKVMVVSTTDPNDIKTLKDNLRYPHGITSNAAFDVFYVTAQYGNAIYKISNGDVTEISIDGNPVKFSPDTTLPAPNPHEIIMSPDGAKLFITCQGTNQVVVLDPNTDAVLATIPVGKYPQEMAISKKLNHLFVTCMEAQSRNGAPFRGAVYEIDCSTNAVVGVIEANFSQPHGVAVDDVNGVIYIGNRNATSSGPAPHHTSDCGGGRNGYLMAFDLFSLQRVGVKSELTPDPYGCDVRFKP